MLKAIAMLLLSSIPLFASVPTSESIGRIATDVAEGSITEIALEAAGREYTEEWLDDYAVDKVSFGEAYSPLLSEVLPLDNPVAGMEKGGAVSLMSLSDGTVLSFIFRNGRIVAVSRSA